MRAWDITLFLIIIQACIGLINGIGLFDTEYFVTQDDLTTRYTIGDIADLHDVKSGGGVSQMSYFDFAVTFGMAGINLLFNIMGAIIFIFPVLVNQFHLPLPFAAVLQSMIYLQVAWGYAQWKSGRTGRGTD